jgi:hypothetical protein
MVEISLQISINNATYATEKSVIQSILYVTDKNYELRLPELHGPQTRDNVNNDPRQVDPV